MDVRASGRACKCGRKLGRVGTLEASARTCKCDPKPGRYLSSLLRCHRPIVVSGQFTCATARAHRPFEANSSNQFYMRDRLRWLTPPSAPTLTSFRPHLHARPLAPVAPSEGPTLPSFRTHLHVPP